MGARPDPTELGLIVAQLWIIRTLGVVDARLNGAGEDRIGASIALGSDQHRAGDQDAGQQSRKNAEQRQRRLRDGQKPSHVDPAPRRLAGLGTAESSVIAIRIGTTRIWQ